MKNVFKIWTHIYVFILFKKILKEFSGSEGDSFRTKYSLRTDNDDRIINPKVVGSTIEFLIPLTDAIINAKVIDEYIFDHKSSIDLIFFEARIASYVDVTVEDCYAEGEDGEVKDVLKKVVWSINTHSLWLSVIVYSTIIFAILALFFVLF